MAVKELVPRFLFIASCSFLALVYGHAASRYGWFPSGFFDLALSEMEPPEIVRRPGASRTTPMSMQGSDDPEMHYRHKARHRFQGARTYDGGAEKRGKERNLTLISSYWRDDEWRTGVRLIDEKGATVHHWSIDITALWPTSPFRDPYAGRLNKAFNYVHGTFVFPNGDLLCNIELFGLMRFDVHGKLLWQLERRTHHSIHPANDGNFWVCATEWVPDDQVARRYPGLSAPLTADLVLLVSPQGKVLKEIRLLDIIYRSRHQALLWTTQNDFPRFDMLHLNDVEPLPEPIAAEYPMFEAGDLLLSLRMLNLVLVLNPKTQTIRWSASGQFVEQHDPDFVGGGWISVFDNRCDSTHDGSKFGGSRISVAQPHTGALRTIYPHPKIIAKNERRFFTQVGGRSQSLPNGHWLITETSAGRIFEIDADGRTVWEWGQEVTDEGDVPEVHEGTRTPFTRADVERWLR